MSVIALKPWLEMQNASIVLVEQLHALDAVLPERCSFNDDCWDVLSWETRLGNRRSFNLKFQPYQNQELKQVLKLYTLHQRLTQHISAGTAQNYMYRLLVLDEILGERPLCTLITADFYEAQRRVVNERPKVAFVSAVLLGKFAKWLQRNFALRLSYENTVDRPWIYGRQGTDKGREAKLVPIEVLRDLVAAAGRADLCEMDKFYLSAFIVDLATGLRVSELATLPVRCLIQTDGKVGLKVYTEKGGKLGIRWFPQDMLPAVKTAIEHLKKVTDAGREVVAKIRANPGLDWKRILADHQAFRYFAKKFAHDWTKGHSLINPSGAWYKGRYIDVISVLEASGGKKARAARRLGIDESVFAKLVRNQHASRKGRIELSRQRGGRRERWTSDSRVINLTALQIHCGIELGLRRDIVRDIFKEAQSIQLEGKIYPAPETNLELEIQYQRKIQPVIVNKKGESLLEPEDALFVVPKHLLVDNKKTKDWDYLLITDCQLSTWFRGKATHVGTKAQQDSVFSRLGIEDPRTGTIAKIVWHDVRHWLNTMYKQGGLTEEQVALIMGRKLIRQNETYDQTLATTRAGRLAQMQQSIRYGHAVGQVADNYVKLASKSRKDAEQYLLAATRMVNRMPHGACTLNMSMNPCPHNLSCFSCNDSGDPCKHLIVDTNEISQIQEIIKIKEEAIRLADWIPEESPQHAHFTRVVSSTTRLLTQTNRGEGKNDDEA